MLFSSRHRRLYDPLVGNRQLVYLRETITFPLLNVGLEQSQFQ